MITLNLRERLAEPKLQLPAAPAAAHPDRVVVKSWCRRHADGSTGSVVAWSDGRYSGVDAGVPAGGDEAQPSPYRTLAEAFTAVEEAALRRGHSCGMECELWREGPAAARQP